MRQVSARDLMGYGTIANQVRTPEQRAILDACARSFTAFLPYWRFQNRETGQITSFDTLWPGQAEFADLMEREPWIFALKAGKLGFTELACAYDGWIARFGPPNARVHLFSQDLIAAQSLIRYVRFGLDRLPPWMRLPLADEAGAATTTTLKLRAGYDDIRTIVAYASSANAAIDQTATHLHVDELSHMPFAEQTWYAVSTGIAPDGSCHIVTRGAGDEKFSAHLWEIAQLPGSRLQPFFAPYTARPGRDADWRGEQSTQLSNQQLLHFAPVTAEDALAGDETAAYIPLEVWDRCLDAALPPLVPGDNTPVVIGVDAAVSGDSFAVVVASRHPARPKEAAIRQVRLWTPPRHGQIDFNEVELYLRQLCDAQCIHDHPESAPAPGCSPCTMGFFPRPGLRVITIVYDPFQLAQMMQRLTRDRVAHCLSFDQGSDRLIADSTLYQLAHGGRLSHNGDPVLREHIGNAAAKIAKDEDTKMRMIKRGPSRQIDAAVASSMAVHRILALHIS